VTGVQTCALPISGGTLSVSLTKDASGIITAGTATGTVTLSGGPITTETWNVTGIVGSASGNTVFTGTISFDGTSFDAKML
jgi:hypothetical protein